MSGSLEKSLKLTNIALLFSGIRLYPSNNAYFILFLDYLFIFNFVWLYGDVFGEFFWLFDGIQKEKSFSELSLIAPCTTICLLSTAKIVPMFYYRKNVLNVIERLKKIHSNFDEKCDISSIQDAENFKKGALKLDSTESQMFERKIVMNGTKFLNFVIHLLYYSSAVVIVAFTTLPLMSMGYIYYKTGEWELQLPFLTKYFFDPFTKVTWPIVYLHQVWSTFIAGFNVFGTDTFVYTFCTYAHIHFRILCHKFEHVVSDSKTETRHRLKVLIERHQELIELVDQVELISSKSTLFNIITSSVLICLSAFNVTILDDGAGIFAFFTFLMMSLSQISLLCLFGDLLMRSNIQGTICTGCERGQRRTKYCGDSWGRPLSSSGRLSGWEMICSMKVAEGIYNSRWYDADPCIKRSIFLILIRSQKPCRLTAANFANLNLTAFTTILSRSWSYFALLRTVYK